MYSPQLQPVIQLEPLIDNVDSLASENTAAFLNRIDRSISAQLAGRDRIELLRSFNRLIGSAIEGRSREAADLKLSKLKKESMSTALFDIRNEIQRIRLKLKREPGDALVKLDSGPATAEFCAKRGQVKASHRKTVASTRLAGALSVAVKRSQLLNFLRLYTNSACPISHHLTEMFGRSTNRFARLLTTGIIPEQKIAHYSQDKVPACRLILAVLRSMYQRRLLRVFTKLLITT